MKTKLIKLILIPIALFYFLSCTANSIITINKNGSGNVSLQISIPQELIDYYRDLAELKSSSVSFDFLNKEKLKEALSNVNGLVLKDLKLPKDNELFLVFSFNDLNTVLKDKRILPLKEQIELQKGNENKIFLKQLDASFFAKLCRLFITDPQVNVDDFLPFKGETPQDYYGRMDYLFENSKDLVRKATISLTFNVEGRILKHNGILIKDNSVRFTKSLEEILFTRDPLSFYLSFQ